MKPLIKNILGVGLIALIIFLFLTSWQTSAEVGAQVLDCKIGGHNPILCDAAGQEIWTSIFWSFSIRNSIVVVLCLVALLLGSFLFMFFTRLG